MCVYIGLVNLGCYQLLPTLGNLSQLRTSQEGVGSVNKTDLLRECGKDIKLRDHSYFALGRDVCYGSDDVLDFIRGGPLAECKGNNLEDTSGEGLTFIEVYQIIDREALKLSVRTMEDCGVDFCHHGDGDMFCFSGSIPIVNHLTLVLTITLISLGSILIG